MRFLTSACSNARLRQIHVRCARFHTPSAPQQSQQKQRAKMASPVQALPTPDSITSQEFQEALGRYPALIQAISDTKGAKHGEKTLAELDNFRYLIAPTLFGLGARPAKRMMVLDDIKVLVNWKLRHGKFRPTLMKLVSQNDPTTASKTVKEAVSAYAENKDATKAIEALSQLRGIGPATASLLLAVHDPAKVVFFADEAYWWLCCGGRKDSIKYNIKEYQSLERAMKLLAARLGVEAVDIEQVAFVLMKHEEVVPFAAAATETVGDVISPLPEVVRKKIATRPPAVRRKSSDERKRKQQDPRPDDVDAAATTTPSAPTEDTAGLRRSKRGKRAS
ncbi:hypothetical protein MAPG_03065 [Magnaporthiopsis poae ATCC 64411]|uniref:Uncharacterized protein n=1 Tax=Magnaporthiopsis poae (strain ATCC 64411 / 73-15) TaxID=644358 RepID=A0A0C4DT16_MAGP6|nr:hypothetical protein MAPG_03065 [Magnaporthiopsis poae ATCC 64411]